MKKSRITLFASLLVLLVCNLANEAFGCDRSSLSMLSVTPYATGQYQITLRYCVGGGRSGLQSGAGNDTSIWALFCSRNAGIADHPASLVSPQTGYTYLDTMAGTDTLVYYNQNYVNEIYEPWACISSTCGPIQTVCIDFAIVTNGLPDSLWIGGAEGAGNIGAGCCGPEMKVYPASIPQCGIQLHATVNQPVCMGSTGSISLNPTGGNAPYSYTWSNGATTSSISGLAPGIYMVSVSDVSRVCSQTASYYIGSPQSFSANLGADKTVYRGYAPRSCTVLSPTMSGGVAPFTYRWSNNSTASSINVCPTINSTYAVTVTDSRGCTAIDDIVVNVIDVRCGSGLTKVTICHSGTTMCVTSSQATTHLGHGDALGACVNKGAEPAGANDAVAMEFKLSGFPVPAKDRLHVDVQSPEAGAVTLEVFDLQGKRVLAPQSIEVAAASLEEITVNVSDLNAGIYLARVTHSASGVQSLRFSVMK